MFGVREVKERVEEQLRSQDGRGQRWRGDKID
jgi:hypothetical protein